MKPITTFCIIILILFFQTAIAQEVSFKQIRPEAPYDLKADFISARAGKSQFIDIDFDGDQDVYISDFSQLYINDGNGNFEEASSTGIEKLGYSSNAIADFDNDGLLDIFQSGINEQNKRVTQLYRADSLYHFTLDTTNNFLGLALTFTDFSDVDGDNDIDLIIAGQDQNRIPRTRFYINQGNMIFTLGITTFPDVLYPSVNFVDIDNDDDDDLVLTGNNKGTRITKVYRNDSLGNFTEDLNQNLDQVYAGVTHFFDADNDGDLDLILTGDNTSKERIAKLYLNDGQGIFSISNSSNFLESFDGGVGSGYINNDSLLDVLITGFDAVDVREKTNIYLNNGNGSFSKDLKNDIRGVARGSVSFADINTDGIDDLLITGDSRYGNGVSALFLNDSIGKLRELRGTSIRELSSSIIETIDYNSDSFADLFVSGYDKNNNKISELYLNDKLGNFELDTSAFFQNIICHEALAEDFDNDNFDDLLISGSYDNTNSFVSLYLNDQNNGFNKSTITFDSLRLYHILYFDVNNDGLKDILVNGNDNQNVQRTYVYYSSNVPGNFLPKTILNIEKFYNGGIDFADIDNDNDFDFLISGAVNSTNRTVTALYINDGTGSFSKQQNIAFKSLQFSTVNFIDIDNDGDKDCFLSGRDRSNINFSILYINNNGIFSEFDSFNFEKTVFGTIDFFDIDGDSLLDLFITGIDTNGIRVSKFYVQFNKLEFRAYSNNDIEGFQFTDTKIVDLNNDSLLDILISGSNDKYRSTTKAFLNNTCQVNFKVDSIILDDTLLWINNKYYTTSVSDERYRIESEIGCDTVYILFLHLNDSIIDPNKGNSKFELYPNPVKEKLNLKINFFQNPLHANFYNMNGTLIKTFYFSSTVNQIDIEFLNAGIYIMEIEDERQLFIKY